MNNTYTTYQSVVYNNAPTRRSIQQVVVPKGPHTITITNQQYHSVGVHLVAFLAEHIGIGNYKLRFVKNVHNQVIENKPVDIEFVNAEFEMLFKLLTGNIIESVKPEY
jgi:hypothetical protein